MHCSIDVKQPGWRYAPLGLAAFGALFGALAVVDKVIGLVQRPLHLATLAYVSLFALLAWAFLRGIPTRPARQLRLSGYAAFLILNLLSAAYVLAWRVSADPTPVLLQSQLARADQLLEQGDKDGAHLIYREARQRFPDSFAVLMRLGAVNYQIADYERARKYFSRALEVAPADSRWRALNDLGQTYWKLRQAEDAIEFYHQARRAGMPESELVEWHYRLGWAYFDVRNYDAAIEHYSAVAAAGEKYVAASYYNIACALAQKVRASGDPRERAALTRQAVESLQQAWKAITSPEEQEALRTGLLGSAEERDPELAPLRASAEFASFVEEIRAE